MSCKWPSRNYAYACPSFWPQLRCFDLVLLEEIGYLPPPRSRGADVPVLRRSLRARQRRHHLEPRFRALDGGVRPRARPPRSSTASFIGSRICSWRASYRFLQSLSRQTPGSATADCGHRRGGRAIKDRGVADCYGIQPPSLSLTSRTQPPAPAAPTLAWLNRFRRLRIRLRAERSHAPSLLRAWPLMPFAASRPGSERGPLNVIAICTNESHHKSLPPTFVDRSPFKARRRAGRGWRCRR